MNVEIYQLSETEFGCFIGDSYIGAIRFRENEFVFQFYWLNQLLEINSRQLKTIVKKIDQLNKAHKDLCGKPLDRAILQITEDTNHE